MDSRLETILEIKFENAELPDKNTKLYAKI